MSKNSNGDTDQAIQPMTTSTKTIDVQEFLQKMPMNSNHEPKRSRTISQPKGTITYTIGDHDTLEKVALRFNSTPSELLQLNKLNSRIIFPGQTLYVPEASSMTVSIPSADISNASAISPSASTKPKEGEAFVLHTDRRSSSGTLSNPPEDGSSVVWSMTRQPATRPGHAQRLSQQSSLDSDLSGKPAEKHPPMKKSISSEESPLSDEEYLQRFLKTYVRLMTEDRKSVGGTLLVTPNAIMFDPDLLDPLVKENGCEPYGLILRMNFLAGIALYEDIAFYENAATARDGGKRQRCYSESLKNTHEPIRMLSQSHEDQVHEVMSHLLDQIEQQSNPSISNEKEPRVLFRATSAGQRQRLVKSSIEAFTQEEDVFLPTPSGDDSLNHANDESPSFEEYKHAVGILSNGIDPDSHHHSKFSRIPSQTSFIFDWTQFRRAVRVRKGCQLENCVPMDHYHHRFDEIDKLLQQQQQHFTSPHPIEIPYYLCLKVSTHTHDVPSLQAREYRKSHEKAVDNIHGRKQLEREYWFSVPKEKTDSLCTFFLRWTPEHESNPLMDEEHFSSTKDPSSQAHGFVLLANDDPELTSDQPSNDKSQKTKTHYLKRQNTLLKEWELRTDHITMMQTVSSVLSDPSSTISPSPSLRRFTLNSLATRLANSKKHLFGQIPHPHPHHWIGFRKRAKNFLSSSSDTSDHETSPEKIISVDEIYRRYNSNHSNQVHSYLDGIPPPIFLRPSSLIDEYQSKQILVELPARLHALNWSLKFSTEADGFSLNQLYRRSLEIDRDSPSLLIIRDIEQHIFGAFVPHRLLISEGFYGTGESFLFTFHPQFRVFNWSGENEFFVKGDLHSIGFGCGEGTYGLWLDGELYRGRTGPSKTFHNDPLTPKEDFIIASVEVWTFVD